MWSHEALSAERYRPLLTATQRKKLLDDSYELSRKERQRLRRIALAGIYDLSFLLSSLPDKDLETVLSYSQESHKNPLEDSRLENFHQEYTESWDPPSEIEYRDSLRDLVSDLDSSSELDFEVTLSILKRLDTDPKLAEMDMERRSKFFEPLAEWYRLGFDFGLDAALFVLFMNIEDGLRSNDITTTELIERFEGSRDRQSPENEERTEEWQEQLRSFENELDELASDGSLIADIEQE